MSPPALTPGFVTSLSITSKDFSRFEAYRGQLACRPRGCDLGVRSPNVAMTAADCASTSFLYLPPGWAGALAEKACSGQTCSFQSSGSHATTCWLCPWPRDATVGPFLETTTNMVGFSANTGAGLAGSRSQCTGAGSEAVCPS